MVLRGASFVVPCDISLHSLRKMRIVCHDAEQATQRLSACTWLQVHNGLFAYLIQFRALFFEKVRDLLYALRDVDVSGPSQACSIDDRTLHGRSCQAERA
jgi:hypothetical protein